MPRYSVTKNWSANIAVAAGDLIQATAPIRIRAAGQAADPAYLELPSPQVYRFETATNINIRSLYRDTTANVIKGL